LLGTVLLTYDQQSGLMSHLFQNVLKSLNVDSKIALAGFHTRTGLAERQIRTISDILKSYIHEPEYAKNWDSSLNYLAFNVNQMPCKTLGFSAHEVVYGRNLRSELDRLRDEFWSWDAGDKAVRKNVIAFMTELQTRLQNANEAAKQHASAEQTKTCAWYLRKQRRKFLNQAISV